MNLHLLFCVKIGPKFKHKSMSEKFSTKWIFIKSVPGGVAVAGHVLRVAVVYN
jgi:hypothetical protein